MTLPQTRDREKSNPMGKIARKYVRFVMGTECLESRHPVQRAMNCVTNAEENICHAVRKIGYLKFALWRIHLLKRMTRELMPIHNLSHLCKSRTCSAFDV